MHTLTRAPAATSAHYHHLIQGRSERKGLARSQTHLISYEPRKPSRLHTKRLHKFSPLTTTTIILTSLTLPAAIGFLGFLWSYPHRHVENSTWHRIVLDGWVTRSITLTAAIIRICVSLQAVFTTSMLASLIMERHGVTLYASAQVAAIRIVNNGPFTLLSALQGSFAHSSLLSSVTTILYILTLLLQLTSTVLVSDLGTGVVMIPKAANQTLAALSPTNLNQTSAAAIAGQIEYWMNNQQEFQTYAEYQEPARREERSVNDKLRDTGVVLRAFVPFANASARTSIKHFEGAATVLDSRVTCIRPKFHSGLSFALNGDEGWLMNGTLLPDASPEGLILTDQPAYLWDLNEVTVDTGGSNQNKETLTWAQEVPFAHEAGEWNIVQKFMRTGPALISRLDPRFQEAAALPNSDFSYTDWQLSGAGTPCYIKGDSIPLMTGRAYELLNITASANVPTLVNSSTTNGPSSFFFSSDQSINKLVVTPDHEWLVFTIPRIPGWRVAATLCFDSIVSINANVVASSEEPSEEPKLTAWNASSYRFNMKDIRQQLGAISSTNLSKADRGIMTLHTTPAELQTQVSIWVNESRDMGRTDISFPSQNFIKTDLGYQYSSGTFMCAACGLQFPGAYTNKITYSYIGIQQLNLFQDVMRSTGNTALAWQALYTYIGRSAYYDLLSYFNIPDRPQVSWYRDAQFPQTSRGLVAVIVTLCAHLVISGVVTVLFITKTNFSRIGDNSWQTLAQTDPPISKDLEPDLSRINDREVKKRLAASGLKKEFVMLKSWGDADGLKIRLTRQ